jgi:hypothetical protein
MTFRVCVERTCDCLRLCLPLYSSVKWTIELFKFRAQYRTVWPQKVILFQPDLNNQEHLNAFPISIVEPQAGH